MSEESENWKDYRQGWRQITDVYTWVWRMLLGQETQKSGRKLLILFVLSNAMAMIMPWTFGHVIDRQIHQDAHHAYQWFTILSLSVLIRWYIRLREGLERERLLGSSHAEVDHVCTTLFMEKSLGQHIRESDRLSASNMEKGRARVLEIVQFLFCEGIDSLVFLSFSIVCLLVMNPLVGLVIILLILISVIWSFLLNHRVALVCVPLDAEFRKWNRYRTERWDRADKVKALGKEAEEIAHMKTWFQDFLTKDRRFWLWFIYQVNFRHALASCAVLAVFFYGIKSAWDASLLVPIITWSWQVVDNIWRLSNVEHRLSWSMPAICSLREALSIPPDVVDHPEARELQADHIRIEIAGLTHTYRASVHHGQKSDDRPVLKNVSFTIESGEVVGLIGRSGAGKSTIMRLLQRGMDPDCGSIKINGIDLREIQRILWLRHLGYVPQQPSVWDATLGENLLYALPVHERNTVSELAQWELMRQFEIDFGDRLTHGLQTRVGRGGIRLSGGESQRLMIGSAVITKPRVLLVDEATSSLDSTTERAVQEGLRMILKSGCSGLIIAHRLSTIQPICHKFVVLRRAQDVTDGSSQIEAIGHSFEELWKISPTFRQLAQDQGITV